MAENIPKLANAIKIFSVKKLNQFRSMNQKKSTPKHIINFLKLGTKDNLESSQRETIRHLQSETPARMTHPTPGTP